MIAKEAQMAETQRALRIGLSALIGLSIDGGLDRVAIASELRHAADLVAPREGVRYFMDERMSIDPGDIGER
jgi:hypothetical protein